MNVPPLDATPKQICKHSMAQMVVWCSVWQIGQFIRITASNDDSGTAYFDAGNCLSGGLADSSRWFVGISNINSPSAVRSDDMYSPIHA